MTQAQTRQGQGDVRGRSTDRFFATGTTEARPGIFTSEMWMAWIAAIVLVVAAYISDTFDNDLGWILGASMIGAYILSRGFAKSGSREGPFFIGSSNPDER